MPEEVSPTSKGKKKGLRTGFTTGACAAAAAKAAARVLIRAMPIRQIETTLPNGNKAVFPIKRCERTGNRAVCSVVKDAGDDPDCTHGAELTAEVELTEAEGIRLLGGLGVASVTKPGLGLEVGAPAINPVPRKNITEMVLEELRESRSGHRGACVTISVPGGEEMARQTLNARLGLLGGISILGTTGLVKPYSTAAFRASIVQAIDVAAHRGRKTLVLTTGGKSEQYAMALFPELPEEAFIQMGDFVGAAVRHCAKRKIDRAIVVGMMGKLSKIADGKLQTHAAGSQVNLDLLAELAAEAGGSQPLCDDIRKANTARHALELCQKEGLAQVPDLVCCRIVEHLSNHIKGKLLIEAHLVDFDGKRLGRCSA
jgi:cobalt-precorrin-5B (C1)-methyltransferase